MSEEKDHESHNGVSYGYQDTAVYRQDHSSSTQGASPEQGAQQLFQLPSERFAQERVAAFGQQAGALPVQPIGACDPVVVDFTISNVDEYFAYRRACNECAADSDLAVTVEMSTWDADNFRKYQVDISSDSDAPPTAVWEPPNDGGRPTIHTSKKGFLLMAIGFIAFDALVIYLIRTNLHLFS